MNKDTKESAAGVFGFLFSIFVAIGIPLIGTIALIWYIVSLLK
jgi:hypothetical protein